jgi:23S rRNA (guanosine2251-2'-O)-methyltransferase
MIIWGINPVVEALRADRVKALRVGGRGDGRLADLLALARARGVRVYQVGRDELDRDARRGVHQGVVAEIEAPPDYSIEELLRAATSPPLFLVLDGIEDPHNLGAILRTADAAGVHGIVRQSRRAAALDGTAAKASAGAVAHVRIAEVVNIARALGELKEAGLWTVGLAADGGIPYTAVDFTLPSAIVLGAEGIGLRRLVRDTCDHLAVVPMRGHVGSLNVSVAAGVALFEALRQRELGKA